MFTTHRKLLVAIAGLALIVGKDYFNLEIPAENADSLVDMALALLTALGIERVPNS